MSDYGNLQKACQKGSASIADANNLLAECHAALGRLIAENEESSAVIDRLAKILAGVAVALKGEELPLSRHSYHDLVECVTVLKLENDLRKAENEALRKELDSRHPFKFSQEAPAIGFTGCVICGAFTDHGGLQCPKLRAYSVSSLTPKEFKG